MKLNFNHPANIFRFQNAITVILLAFLVGCGTNENQVKSPLPTSVPSIPSTASTPSTPNTVVTKPEITPSSSATDPYQDAISKAIGAATITQSAQSQSDWNLIVGMWQEAINLMGTVPKTSSNYALVKTKTQEYQSNLKFAQQMALKPPSTSNPEPLADRISNTVQPQNNKNNVQSVIASQSLNQNSSLNTQNKQMLLSENAINTSNNQISGYLQLVDSKIVGTDSNCYGTGGYEDIQGAMPVTIKDGQGKILALGKTSDGKRPKGQYSIVTCNFNFQVNNVPKSDFYSIEVGRRGQLNYSYEELKNKNWKVSFSIG